MREFHLLYGQPPRELATPHASARQCSPLMPGSVPLEECAQLSAASALIYAPPGTIDRRYVLALSLRSLAVGAPLIALAPKDKGGGRIAAELKAFGCDVVDASRAHHRIVTTTRPAKLHSIDEALTAGGLQQHPTHGLWTQPGVFSWDRIDAGSALLLKHLPQFSGRGADLGCGIGVLSRVVLASPDVSELILIDIDRRAIFTAQKNIDDGRAGFLWADIRDSDLPARELDFIVMNPPFHDAGVEDKALGQRFVACAASLLKSGGTLWLTANKHLPYEALLVTYFSRTMLIDEADGFKIYMAEK